MTAEGAIKQLDGAEMILLNREFKPFNQAIIMAISALRAQQEQCGLTNEQLGRLVTNSYIEGYEDCKAGKPPLEKRSNAPLTLDELRQMDGEPVWVKLFDPDEEFWVLRNEWVDTRNPEPLILFHMRWYSHADYGKTWLAYRHKPEEGTTGC